MPPENRIRLAGPLRRIAVDIYQQEFIKTPGNAWTFCRKNVIFSYQPTQAAHDMRWLGASSRGAPDSFRLSPSWLPIELCRERNLNWRTLGSSRI
jgi:hypothetical protein